MDGRLEGFTVVVTGGNGGIGAGIARGVAKAGASVAIWGRNVDNNARTVAELKELGADAEAYACDVTDEDAVKDHLARTIERFGKVDSMVANAGMNHTIPFLETSTEHFRALVRNNLESAFICFREAARHMVERGQGGSLVGVSSIAAHLGQVNGQPYSAAKSGIEGLIRAMATELGPHRIRCNTLVPGFIMTPIWGEDAPSRLSTLIERTSARTPAQRWGTPEDFEEVGAFLCDPRLYFQTADTLVVDGGFIRT